MMRNGGGPDNRDAAVSRLIQVGFLAALIILWYLAANRWGVNRLLLPDPVAVADNFIDIVLSGEYIDDLKVTLGELAAAFAIAVTCGITTGYVISRSRYATAVFEPMFAVALCDPDHPVPAVIRPILRLGTGVENRDRRDHQFLSRS